MLAEEFGAAGIRLPRDELQVALRHDLHQILPRVFRAWALSALSARSLRRVVQGPLRVTDRCFGVAQTGRMDEDYVGDALRRLDVSSAEFVFHPTTGPRVARLGANSQDLATLMSPRLRRLIERHGFHLTTYPRLDHVQPACQRGAA